MPDSFFQYDKKRKRPSSNSSIARPRRPPAPRSVKKKPKSKARDEDLSSESGGEPIDLDRIEFRAGREEGPIGDDEYVDENETAAEKRVRLAKGYLARVRDEVEAAEREGDYDAAEIDRELIASRLQQDVAEAQGRIHHFIGSHVLPPRTHFISTPSHLPTSVALTPSSLFISTKRGSIFRHSLPSLRKIGKAFGQARFFGPKADAAEGGHKGEILCLAASEDGKWLVSGGRDRVMGVWNVEADEPRWTIGMRGHKDAVTSIALPPLNNPSHHILSASLSRHLALHSLATLSIIDTFFGHQDSITSVSALKPTSAVTAGSRDRTCRWWKVEEEVQLVFRGGGRTFEKSQAMEPAEDTSKRLVGGDGRVKVDRKGKGRDFVEGSIDCVCMLDDSHFVSGGDSGSISLWSTGKKKPIFTKPLTHGVDELLPDSDHSMPGARWITSLASVRGTDLFASGSWDGSIRLWALDTGLRSFSPASTHSIPVAGVVNALQILSLSATSVDSTTWQSSPKEIPAPIVPDEDTEPAPPTRARREILLVAAVGQEPRLGRWMRIKDGVRNGAAIAHLQLDETGQAMMG